MYLCYFPVPLRRKNWDRRIFRLFFCCSGEELKSRFVTAAISECSIWPFPVIDAFPRFRYNEVYVYGDREDGNERNQYQK